MSHVDHDVVIVGAGGDGPVAAWRLGQLGLDVLLLEAGPFYGNENWEKPTEEPGAETSSDPADLSGELEVSAPGSSVGFSQFSLP